MQRELEHREYLCGPPIAVMWIKMVHRYAKPRNQVIDDAIDFPLKAWAHGALSIEGGYAEYWHFEESVISAKPVGDEWFDFAAASHSGDQIRVVIKYGAVANHDLVARRCLDFFGDLRVQDPRLRVIGGVFVDRQRAAASDLLHDVHTHIESLELRGQVEAQRCLADTMRANKCDFQASPFEWVEGSSHCGNL